MSYITMTDIIVLLILMTGLILVGHALYAHKALSKFRKRIRSFRTQPPPYPPTKTTQIVALQDIKPYQFPPLKIRTTTRMAMGLKRLDDSNWLTIDPNYLPEHTLRLKLLTTCRPNVIQCLAPSIPACHEVLDLAVSFLISRFPLQFTTSKTPKGPVIHNHITGETFPIGCQCQNPLEVAALLAMEDFNILIKDPVRGEYCLQASATLFPAGWRLQERIGTSLAYLHAPVPGWKEKLGPHVNRYFDHLSPRTSMERSNLFIQTTPHLFQDEPESIVVPSSLSPSPLNVSDITIRRERQTFTRLPKSNAVLFTVRTYMTPLTELGNDELAALRSQIWGWEEDIKNYKGWGLWGETVEGLCEGKLGRREVGERVVKSGCPV